MKRAILSMDEQEDLPKDMLEQVPPSQSAGFRFRRVEAEPFWWLFSC